jgi:hypothetical protein
LKKEFVYRQARRHSMIKAIPEGFHSVTPKFKEDITSQELQQGAKAALAQMARG